MKKMILAYMKFWILITTFVLFLHPQNIFADESTVQDAEKADTKETAIVVQTNRFIKGRIEHIDDVDYYKFTTTDSATQYVLFDYSDKEQKDDILNGKRPMQLKIYSEDGTYQYYDFTGENIGAGGVWCYNLEPNTTYYIKAGEEKATSLRRGNYGYSFFIFRKNIYDGVGDTFDTAVPLAENKLVKRNGVWGQDIYKVDATKDAAASEYRVEFTNYNSHIYDWVTAADGTYYFDSNLDAIVGYSKGSAFSAGSIFKVYRDGISEDCHVSILDTICPGHVYYIVLDCECADYSLKFVKTEPAKSNKVSLNKTSATVYAGKTITLKVSGTSKTVKWSTSNKKVATVNSKGKVTAKKKGTATITAKVSGKTYTCKVTVKNPYLNATKKSIVVGKTYTLKLTGATAKKYKSSNKSVATVSSKGKITAKKAGKATITVTDSNKKIYMCKVTVTAKSHTHKWIAATCTAPRTCSVCGATEGAAKGHNYQWVVTREAAVGVTGLKENKCTVCGDVNGTQTIPALEDVGQETAWVYSNGNTHREKTMYDGTVVKEDLFIYNGYPMWGYFDDNAAASMTNEVINMLANSGTYAPFISDSSWYEDAKYFAFWYALKGGSSQAYHSNHGGLPNVSDNRRYITLSDGNNQNNYIACFVKDGYQENSDYTYGQYWRSWFGTYYASGNF